VDKFWVNPSGRSHKKPPEPTPQAQGDLGKRTQTNRATPDTPPPPTAQEVRTPKIGEAGLHTVAAMERQRRSDRTEQTSHREVPGK